MPPHLHLAGRGRVRQSAYLSQRSTSTPTCMATAKTSPATTQALLITGETYMSRRDLKRLGGKWYPNREGWIVPLAQCEAAEQLANGHNFIVEIIDVEAGDLEHPTGERLR